MQIYPTQPEPRETTTLDTGPFPFHNIEVEIERLCCETRELCKEIAPVRNYLKRLFKRLEGLNKQRHTAQLCLLERRGIEVPKGKAQVTTQESVYDYLRSLPQAELGAVLGYYEGGGGRK